MVNKKFLNSLYKAILVLGVFLILFISYETEKAEAIFDETVNPLGKITNVYDANGKFQYTLNTTKRSMNTSSRDGKPIDRIVIHHWGDKNYNNIDVVVNWLSVSYSRVSAHHVVEKNKVYNLVPEERTAWHAGNYDVNQRSIGIECRPEARDEDYETIGMLVGRIWSKYGKLPLYPHKAYINTYCPGQYDLNRIKQIAEKYYTPPIDSLEWRDVNGRKFLYSQGNKVLGLQKIDNKTYYFDEEKGALRGRHTISGKTYYFHNQDFYAMTGWIENDNDSWYYANAFGELALGWNLIEGKWYYFEENNLMKIGWLSDANKWYYLDKDGAMTKGWKSIEGNWHFFKDSGEMSTSWINDKKGDWYYANKSGYLLRSQWLKDSGLWYYFDDEAKMITGILNISGTDYLFKDSGAMAVGWAKDSQGIWYFANSSGSLVKGWLKYGGSWYFLDVDFKMITGIKEIENKKYFFNNSGVMSIGWSKDNLGTWYYAEKSGELKKGWIKVSNTWYYLDEEYKMVVGTKLIDGRENKFDNSGAWLGYMD